MIFSSGLSNAAMENAMIFVWEQLMTSAFLVLLVLTISILEFSWVLKFTIFLIYCEI